MKSSVNDATAKNCPTCSRPLRAGAPAGLCPACLLAQGAETESGAGGERTRFVPPSLAEVAALFPQLEILGLLGAGGMGAVYKARQPALDRFVALKVLPAGGDGANFEERFNREARALARLSHPNIVAVHEFGQAGGLHYFLMEFVDGANLRQLEQAGRLSPREALQIIPQICDALQYAHDEGVVHRDIKPENVLVDRKGRVKIADFGLAKILGHDPEAARLTVEGQVMGTPHYMAPEQVERPLAVDHRADIYSLGVVFYEMLTGDLPLGKFAPPSRKVQVDVRLDEIVLRALENDPARRYQQASEVKSQVATVVETPSAATVTTPATDEVGEAAPKPGVRHLRWLGIPAVVERDGEREVNFQGALGVFFVMLMASALAQQAVRWATGTQYATTQLGFVTAVLMAIWAIRRTMNRPWDDEPRRAANGTVILPPPPRRRYLLDGFMIAGLLAFVIGIHFFKTQIINPRLGGERSGPLAHQTAELNRETGVLAAKLPGRGTVELVAVAAVGAAPNNWWRPDGTPITNAAFELHNPVEASREDRRAFNLIVRHTDLPNGADGPYYEADQADWAGSGGEVSLNGKSDGRLGQACFTAPASASRASIRVGFSVEPWRTISTHDVNNHRDRHEARIDDVRWDTSIHGSTDTKEGAQITLVMGKERRDWRMRVIALDSTGAERTHQMASGSPGGGTMIWTYTFPGISLKDVKEFRVQVRPVYWTAFPDVRLEPTSPLPSAQPLRLGAPLELTFDELIDFDTGRVAEFPSAKPGENPLAGIGENVLWAQEQGFDAAAGNGELQVLGADFAPLSNADWDSLTPQDVINRLHQGTFHPRALKELRRGEFPATYAYRTREQGYGMIQLVAFEAQRPGATVRLRQVVRPGTEPKTTFGPPTLLSFDELVDFDLGHTADFPAAEPGSNPFAGIGENILWAQENGFDAVAGVGKLDLLGVTVAEINEAEWEAMTPVQTDARLAAAGTKPRELTPINPDRGTSPAYAFRTREGGVGLIRFVEFHQDSTRFTVQFKHAPPPGGAVRVLRAQRDRKTGEMVGRLPGRGTATLVALRPATTGPGGWRRADGQPATGFDRAVTYPWILGAAEAHRFELLFRFTGLPEPAGTPVFEFSQSVRHAAGGRAVLNGTEDGALQPVQVVWPGTNGTASVRVGVPMADWHPIRSYEPLSRSFTKTSWGDDPKWNIEMHTAGVGTKGAQVTVVFGTNYPAWNLRVVARRSRGDDIPGTADTAVTNDPATTKTYVFPGLTKLDEVQNFQVQAQPLQWVEFGGIASRRAADSRHP